MRVLFISNEADSKQLPLINTLSNSFIPTILNLSAYMKLSVPISILFNLGYLLKSRTVTFAELHLNSSISNCVM